jgi:hypothetical protein
MFLVTEVASLRQINPDKILNKYNLDGSCSLLDKQHVAKMK